jgi:pyroglutamyl-peptidase
MKVLLTGFEPFGGHAHNPSEMTVRSLEKKAVRGVILRTLVLPVDAQRAPAKVLKAIDQQRPDVVVMLGEARGRASITIERVAVNLLDFALPDNAGARLTDEPVAKGGPAAYFSTLPVRDMLVAARGVGVPADLSLSAGTYLCNQVMYAALHHISENELDTRAGFVHLPALPESIAETGGAHPTMSVDTLARGVRAMLQIIASGPD